MAAVSGRDYDAMLDIVAAASQGLPEEPLPVPVLEAIRQLIPVADTAAYFEGAPWDRAHRRVWTAGEYVPWTDMERRLMDRLRFSQNPLNPGPATIGRAWRLTDRISIAAHRRSDLYNLLGKRHHIEYSMDYWAHGSDGVLRGFSFDASRRDFSERDRDVLDVLGRHLVTVLSRWDARLSRSAARLGLTRREAAILVLAARGHTNAEIADILSLSAHTVRKHLENAFDRLGVHTRGAAIARAYEGGLLRPGGTLLESSSVGA